MRIIKENICELPESEQKLIENLLEDLDEINLYGGKYLDLNWQDYHNEYSPERVDPCPDYYGYYTLTNYGEIVGVEMDLDTLDTVLCTLYSYIVDD